MAKLRKKDRKAIKENQPSRISVKFTPVTPRTPNQEAAVQAMRYSLLTVLIGTSGTGKTLLAVSEALKALEGHSVKRLVIIRPMVAVGQDLGYLPGGVMEKVAPYATAMLYYIDDLMNSKGYAQKLIDAGVIEVVPLALIRGRTFDDSIILVDEAQNTTPEQMHAALTRMGENSKLFIVGDEAQTDIRNKNGLTDLLNRAGQDQYLNLVRFGKEDIQRNDFLKRIYEWYGQ